jgi:hypothetical protein
MRKRKITNQTKFITIFTILILNFIPFSLSENTRQSLKDHKIFKIDDKEEEIKKTDIEIQTQVSGIVTAQNLYDISSPFDGRVEEVMTELFSHVKTKSLLTKMVSTEMAALIDSTRADSKEQMEERWQDVFSYYEIYPQYEGIVTGVYVSPKQKVYKGDRLFTVARKIVVIGKTLQPIYVAPKPGLTVNLEYSRNKSIKLVTTLKNAIPLKEDERIYRVWLEATEFKDKILIGGSFTGNLFIAKSENTLIVPKKAIIESKGINYMILEVETGLSTTDEIEILRPGKHFYMPMYIDAP